MTPIENEGGRTGVARFLPCSSGEAAFLGSSSVRESVTGAIDVRCGGGTLLEISGVECAYGDACGIWDEGGSGGMAVKAPPPPGTFQSRKSGDKGMSLELKSNGICSKSAGFEVVA
jgi:hypothetical protein